MNFKSDYTMRPESNRFWQIQIPNKDILVWKEAEGYLSL